MHPNWWDLYGHSWTLDTLCHWPSEEKLLTERRAHSHCVEVEMANYPLLRSILSNHSNWLFIRAIWPLQTNTGCCHEIKFWLHQSWRWRMLFLALDHDEQDILPCPSASSFPLDGMWSCGVLLGFTDTVSHTQGPATSLDHMTSVVFVLWATHSNIWMINIHAHYVPNAESWETYNLFKTLKW